MRTPKSKNPDAIRLKTLRLMLGYSQRQMADEFRVTHGAIANWEAGDRPVPGPITRLLDLYEENLGMSSTRPLAEFSDMPASWVARTLRASTTAAKIATKLSASSLRELVAGNERAAQIKAATQEVIGATLAETMGEMKGLIMKVGQMASYMDFALPTSTRKALAALQDSSQAMAPEAVDQIFLEEFGKRPKDLFAAWDERPFAAASIGQVHRARLADGTEVAVKVQYPKIAQSLLSDLKNLSMLDGLGSIVQRYQEKGTILDEMRERFLEECDYEKEAANMELFAQILADRKDVLVPRVHRRFSSKRVLTSDFAEGLRFAEFKRTATQAEKNRIGAVLYDVTFDCLFKHHVFNADPNPGNFLFHRDGRVILLDFGCVKRFPAEFVASMRRFFLAVDSGDKAELERAAHAFGMLPRPDKVDVRNFHHLMAVMGEPTREDRPYRMTQAFVERTWRATFDNPDKFKLGIPKHWLFCNRLQWGLYALLADLEAEANWRELLHRLL